MIKVRIMRLLVFFDLPTGTAKERKEYSQFRKFLLKDGFVMEQYSVYSRITVDKNNTNTHLDRIIKNLPPAGAVQVLQITEQQYEKRKVLVSQLKPSSSKRKKEQLSNQLTLSF